MGEFRPMDRLVVPHDATVPKISQLLVLRDEDGDLVGYRVKSFGDGRHVEVWLMMYRCFNVVETVDNVHTKRAETTGRAWRYVGDTSLWRAVHAAWIWDGAHHTSPYGWFEDLATRVRREEFAYPNSRS